jgi:AraC-like DNA-binding protein
MRDLVSTVILIGVLQGAVLAPVLWARRANRLANRILAALVAAVALMLLLVALEARFALHGHPHLLGLTAPLPFLFGPLLYLYAVALTRPMVRLDPRAIVHALPFAADALFMMQVFYLKGGDEKVAIVRSLRADTVPISLHVVNTLQVVQAAVYLVLTWRALERYRTKMQGYFSDLARIDLTWLKALVLGNAAVWSVVLLQLVIRWAGGAWSALGPVVSLGSALVISLIGYVSLWQPELVQKASAANVAEPDAPKESDPPAPTPVPGGAAPLRSPLPKYQRNRIDDVEAEVLVRRLQALMTEKKLFRDSALTLPTLADEMRITPHMLSQVLNVRVGKSFFDFVNAYRIEAVKSALADPASSGRGVLELAFEAGFNSMSTFNSFFKKHTGMTPTEFRGSVPSKNDGNSRG